VWGGANVACSFFGPVGCGTFFKTTPSGALTTLYSFCSQPNCTDGELPGALVQATNGDFYGTTGEGGANSRGAFFKITPGGTPTTVYSFCSQSGCTDGIGSGGLVQATNGDFYGVTAGGGANNFGTVFKITPGGALTTLYSFCSHGGTNCTDGAYPIGLVQATNGDFYGTTSAGGNTTGNGTVFKITPTGALTTLHRFCSQGGSLCTDGSFVNAGLVQATNGDFYGTTTYGGNETGDGIVFKITPGGAFSTLYSFCSQGGGAYQCTDGSDPYAGLIQGTDGNLYGTTSEGGTTSYLGAGTIFKITPGGALTTLYSFCPQSSCTDGAGPVSALVQRTNGEFYGTAAAGGSSGACSGVGGCGTVFSLSVGLGPFVETRPTTGLAGRIVEILGTDLTGATSVSFNGTAAVFEVVSSSLIVTKVPAGASTGKVEVVTPGGTLSTYVSFQVRP
jgi:uncharacterized repeat protein (TIGR03803 family)